MARVGSVHEILLRWEVEGKEAEFERFINDEHAPEMKAAFGAEVRLLKGIRGNRMGRYVLFVEYPSTEAFTRFIPLGPGPMTDEIQKVMREHPKLVGLMDKYDSFVGRWLPTDYLETGEATEDVRKKVDAMARTSAHKRATPPLPPF